MTQYWQKFGRRVCFDQILQSVGLDIWDLPNINKHVVNDRNNLCWQGVLERCSNPSCRFIHEKGKYLDDDFVMDVGSKLDRVVYWVVEIQSALPTDRSRLLPEGYRDIGGSYGGRGLGQGGYDDRDTGQEVDRNVRRSR